MAAVLIKEITRRCNEEGIVQAAFTTGALLPIEPVGACRFVDHCYAVTSLFYLRTSKMLLLKILASFAGSTKAGGRGL